MSANTLLAKTGHRSQPRLGAGVGVGEEIHSRDLVGGAVKSHGKGQLYKEG